MTKTIKTSLSFVSVFCFVMFIASFAEAETLQNKNRTVKTNYSSARQQYVNEVNFYKKSKMEFLTAKAKFQKQKNSENKAELEDKTKELLESAVNVAIKKLETIKTWIAENKSLSENDKKSIISEIDEDISWLNVRVSKIQGATLSELKEEAKEVREYWKNNRIKAKRVVGTVQASRINFVINKAETVSEKINEKITELKDAGYNVTELKKKLEDFNEKIELAKEKYNSAQAKFKEIDNLSDADALFKEGHAFVKEANDYVKEAHSILVELVKEMKNIVNG
jgi:chromosome segregation ATPase